MKLNNIIQNKDEASNMNLMTLKIENYGSNTEEVSFPHTCALTCTKRETVSRTKRKKSTH
jgi:hypothetical protein